MKRKINIGGIAGVSVWVQGHPVMMAVIALASYFLLDSYMLNTLTELGDHQTLFCLSIAFAIFYIGYVMQYQFRCQVSGGKDIPAWVRNRRGYAVTFFWALVLIGHIVFISYDAIILNCFPNLESTYYRSQVFLLIFIAPILEELVFRYFLYDRWAQIKFGTVKGMLLTGLLFVVCHPVTSVDGLILYWVPTLLFYLIYDSFGLYGSVIAHMVFNFIAL